MTSTSEKVYDLIICGAGPSGVTAALYAGRFNMDVLVLEKGLIGGVLNYTERICNYPGFPKDMPGRELADMFDKHVRLYVPDENIRFEEVEELTVDPNDDCIKIVKTNVNTYKSHAAVISTGSMPNKLPVDDHDHWFGRGLTYCAVCDGAFHTGKPVVVVGGGNAAVEEAIFLTRYATEVTIVHRRDELRADQILQNEAFNHPQIKFAWDSVVAKLHGDPVLQEVEIENVKTGERSKIPASGIFTYIGSYPNTKYVNISTLNRDENGYIHTDEHMNVGIPGLFATGDVRAFELRQITISSGNGAIAALMSQRFIAELKRDRKYCGTH